jgi:methyl-accepting chemotaxis protein
MIIQLQSGAKSAVDAIKLGEQSIEVNNNRATKTDNMINEMSSVINDIQAQNLQLAAAAEEQAAVSKEINQNVDNIKEVSTNTHDNSHQVLAMAEEINSAVNAINNQLQRFTKG